ncbi:MAG: tRNA uridine-5-carboxymethylaminomethyl(34) synthesis enzyme MnmG [Rikenellaceae bacterium]
MKMNYDIIVVGAGHAGCEAAMAAARLGVKDGLKTLLITQDMTKFANMSCNPAVGGVAKGQIVREIDALGGEMGRITDLSSIQFRMLNMSKGAAMWSPRAQCDKALFSAEWRKTVENQEGLFIWQDSVVKILFSEDKKSVRGVRTQMGVEFKCRGVVLTAGTFLGGLMHCGDAQADGGRAGDMHSVGVTQSLVNVGFEAARMKTGTPARLDGRTIDFSKMEIHGGDENPSKFSFLSSSKSAENQLHCYLVYTSKEVHETLRSGFDKSPLFNGTIKGVGPRYCPSIEDKLRTFAEKDKHQLFLEPEGRDTNEYYLNGFSSSLPWEVQYEALRGIEGFENVHIYRPGYAIEYDYFPPTQLRPTLETKLVSGLYFAGQINGTTGYEEAGAQGLIAGINCALGIEGKSPVILSRDEAYIGVLIDDLVNKGVDEPYRMFTSRAEHRILLRQDNADLRLTPIGARIGLVSEERKAEFESKRLAIDSLMQLLGNTSIKADHINDYLRSVGEEPLKEGKKAIELVARNGVTINGLADVINKLFAIKSDKIYTPEVIEQVEIQIKYKGYIERENLVAQKLQRLEAIEIPELFDFSQLKGLTIEARQKLSRIAPRTIGQASRVPGVSPSDINVLLLKFGR